MNTLTTPMCQIHSTRFYNITISRPLLCCDGGAAVSREIILSVLPSLLMNSTSMAQCSVMFKKVHLKSGRHISLCLRSVVIQNTKGVKQMKNNKQFKDGPDNGKLSAICFSF